MLAIVITIITCQNTTEINIFVESNLSCIKNLDHHFHHHSHHHHHYQRQVEKLNPSNISYEPGQKDAQNHFKLLEPKIQFNCFKISPLEMKEGSFITSFITFCQLKLLQVLSNTKHH